MKKLLLLFLFLSPAVFAQTPPRGQVLQSGSVTPDHLAIWNSNGVIQDGGTSSDSALSSLGITNNTTGGFCISSGRAGSAGVQQLCLGAPLSSSAVISLQNYGTAVAQSLTFIVNGQTFTLPSVGNSIATLSGSFTINHAVCANGNSTTPALIDCAGVSGSFTSQDSKTVTVVGGVITSIAP